MSNRFRRQWLRDARLRAIVADYSGHGGLIPDVDANASPEVWGRWERIAFRNIRRVHLEFTGFHRPDPGLVTIQLLNRPGPFNPLLDNVPEPPSYLAEIAADGKPLSLWARAEDCIYSALAYLEPSRNVIRPYFDDFPAAIHRAFRLLSNNLLAVHQYGDDGSPWFENHGHAVRYILNVDQEERLSETQLYALLILAEVQHALITLEALPDDPTACNQALNYADELIRAAEVWLAEASLMMKASIRENEIKKELADSSHKAVSARAWKGKDRRSVGILSLATKLKQERPNASGKALFDGATRLYEKDGYEIDGYRITVNTEGALVSATVDGKPDGVAVGLSAWQKNYFGR